MRAVRSLPFPLGASILLLQVALGIMLFAVFQEYVPEELGAGDAWGGILLSAYGLARFLSETPTGAMSDRVERKFAFLAGFAFIVPAVAATAFAQARFAHLALAALLGLGTAFVWPATYAITADRYVVAQRGKVIGFLNVCQLAGFGSGALVGAFLVEQHARVLLAIATVTATLAVVPVLLGTPRYRGTTARPGAGRPPLREAWSAQLGFLSMLVLLATVSVSMIVPAIRPYGDEQLGISFSKLTVALIPGVVLGAALYIPAGHLSDRVGRTVPFLAGQLLLIAGMLTVAGTDRVLVAAVGGAVIFAGNVVSVPAFNAAVMDLAPDSHRGTLIGLTVALTGLGLALGPLIGGAVAASGEPADVFRLAALVSGASSLAILVYGRVYRATPGALEER